MPESQQQYSIGAVERDSGIARDTLRVWEKRYGYPVPVRNDKGERVYSEDQLRHLQRIHRLMGQGYRPGKLLRMSLQDLLQIESGLDPEASGQLPVHVSRLIDAVKSIDAEAIDTELWRMYRQQGMTGFILETVAPLLRAVGDSWAAGKLEIYQEHFLTAHLLRIFNIEITRLQSQCKKPLVLLATLPGEEHTLGLMMVAGMLATHQVSSLNLGAEVPVDQVAAAADQFNVDAVGVTFSGAYHYPSIRSNLQELRTRLAEGIELWVGGQGARRMRKLPAGVAKFTTLESLPL